MRQAVIVAAAGLYALDHNVERLADDHMRALRLAEGLHDAGVPVDVEAVETNFVGIEHGPLGLTEEEAVDRAREAGVLLGHLRPGILRAATHMDVSDDDIERAVDVLPDALGVTTRTAAPGAR
jgi:threonine aldolase